MASPRRPSLIAALAIVGSVAVHAALVVGATLQPETEIVADEVARGIGRRPAIAADRVARHVTATRERALLVEGARAERRTGSLRLGDFLIEASRIDAADSGRTLDAEAARSQLATRLEALRAKLAQGDVPGAIADVFGDLAYHGIPGGLVADALLERGGSCEPIAHLVAAALHDVGRGAEVELRVWGRAAGGVGHVSPIALTEEGEIDLMTARPVTAGGARVAPPELVEIYARAHGLAPPLPATGPAAAPSTRASALSIAAGYPPNDDAYPGTLPLFAGRAIADPSGASEAAAASTFGGSDERARDCAHQLRLGTLLPPVATVEAPHGTMGPPLSVDLVQRPRASQLERRAQLMRMTEDLLESEAADEADRLMALACLVALGQRTVIEMTLAGQRALAEEAERKAASAAELGRAAVAAARLEPKSVLSRRLVERYSGATWLLLVLDGGDRLVTQLVEQAERDDWGQVNALAGLVVHPPTRSKAYQILAGMPAREQIDVMHEVFLAQQQMRPWTASLDLDGAEEFSRAYRVFRAMAWRLWDGARPVDEVSNALTREAKAEGLGPAWEPMMFDYYVRNSLLLHVQRSTGREVVAGLLEATRARRGPELELVRRRLEYMAAQPEVDARVLSDAWRIQ